MYRYKIDLITMGDVNELIRTAESIPQQVKIADKAGEFCVSAKSFLGALMAVQEWDDLYLVSEADIYTKFEKFIR